MGSVIMHNVVSIDGFIADDNDDVGPMHEWYFSGDTPIGRSPKEATGSIIPVSGAASDCPAHQRNTSVPCGSRSAQL